MGFRGSLIPLKIINVHVPVFVLFLKEKVFGSHWILRGICDQIKCKSIGS